jgi:hypothetical protein
LYDNERYVLQIDSHMRFVPNWDTKLIGMLAECGGEKSIITTYPAGYDAACSPPPVVEDDDVVDKQQHCHVSLSKRFVDQSLHRHLPTCRTPALLCANEFASDGMLRIASKRLKACPTSQCV